MSVRSCSSSHHSADSSSSNSGTGDETSTSSSGTRGKDMAIVFTCAKCDTRSVKAFSKHSYDKGLVSTAAYIGAVCMCTEAGVC